MDGKALGDTGVLGDCQPERSSGERSNAEYRQVSAYIRNDTHRKVKMALLEQEFSDGLKSNSGRWKS
jgi:hypothetical protein